MAVSINGSGTITGVGNIESVPAADVDFTPSGGLAATNLQSQVEFINKMVGTDGYAVPVAYASGISLTLTSQTVDYNGVIYAPKSSALPFITSSWGTDAAKFRAIQVTDSDLITYTPAGTGAVAATVQAKLRERVSVKDFGAAGDGVTDDTAAIQAAINSGADNIYVPPGLYLVSSTISLSTTRDLTFRGAGRDATAFATSINDGSPVFTISGQWHDIGDFKVTSTTGSLLNFIGIRLGRISTSTSFTMSKVAGIKVSNAAVGIEVYGWINDLDLFYTGCTLGVNGKELNSCVIALRGENNVTGFDLTNVYGTTFSSILEENTFAAGATTGTSLIRKGNAITIASIYLEGGTFSTTVLAFGNGADFIQGLTVSQIKSTVVPADKSPAVLFDRVQGVCVEGVVTNDNRGAVSFGTEVRAIQPQLFTYSANATANTITNSLHDNSRQIRRAETWFGDTFLYRTLATFDTVTKTSATTSNYDSLFITGKQSLRIISGNWCSFHLSSGSQDSKQLPRTS